MEPNNINDDLLLKFVSGKADEKEKGAILDWIEENDENMRVFIELKNRWVLNEMKSYNGIDTVRDVRRGIWLKYIRYAALLLIFLTVAVGGTFYFIGENEIEHHIQAPVLFKYIVNSGVKGEVNLPDGSKVWLNSNSYIICPQVFADNIRELEIEGEGYFDVVSDKKWPMLIKTSKKHTIKVTGTKFNLSSYSNDDKLVVTLISGAVSLLDERGKNEVKLIPNQEMVITDKMMPQLLENPNIVNKTAWKEGLLLFDNTPMKEVIKKMERWYGVTFVINEPIIYDYRFTAKFMTQSITQVLEILRLSANIQYKIEDTTITLGKK